MEPALDSIMNPAPAAVVPAPRRRRISAFIIDHFGITFSMVTLYFVVLGPHFLDDGNERTMGVTMAATMLPIFLLYFAKDAINGISPGKWILGIRVRDANHPEATPPSGRLLLRNITIVLLPIEFIVLAVSADKRRIGDRLAQTIVVNNSEKAARSWRIGTLVATFAIFFTTIFFITAAAMKNSDAYKLAIREIENSEEVRSKTGGIKGYGFTPKGNIQTSNGQGEANLEITVLGNQNDVVVYVYATKSADAPWALQELRLVEDK